MSTRRSGSSSVGEGWQSEHFQPLVLSWLGFLYSPIGNRVRDGGGAPQLEHSEGSFAPLLPVKYTACFFGRLSACPHHQLLIKRARRRLTFMR